MGAELDLMRNYPKSENRLESRPVINTGDRDISRLFGKEYFDGDRNHGYGGFHYDPKYWTTTVSDFVIHYALSADAHILDVGCAKGFMLKDFKRLLPMVKIAGIDISEYAIENSDKEVRDFLSLGDAKELPFEDSTFDLVISINTVHNLKKADCIRALAEIERVSKGQSFVMVDGWRTESERKALDSWVLTAQTILSADRWIELFNEAKYNGDYAFWTV